MGARSKRFLLGAFAGLRITRLPLWGRDQNVNGGGYEYWYELPDCPCGGEIKTWRPPRSGRPPHYQTAPVGARSKQESMSKASAMRLPDCPCGGEIKTSRSLVQTLCKHYQTAPVGARSKRNRQVLNSPNRLPDCPCGGEIKTYRQPARLRIPHYQTAPVGARSKPVEIYKEIEEQITRLPLWGRDQNRMQTCSASLWTLPDCPCGGEIKTRRAPRS